MAIQNAAEEFEKLKQAFKDGLIDQKQFEAEKKGILKKLPETNTDKVEELRAWVDIHKNGGITDEELAARKEILFPTPKTTKKRSSWAKRLLLTGLLAVGGITALNTFGDKEDDNKSAKITHYAPQPTQKPDKKEQSSTLKKDLGQMRIIESASKEDTLKGTEAWRAGFSRNIAKYSKEDQEVLQKGISFISAYREALLAFRFKDRDSKKFVKMMENIAAELEGNPIWETVIVPKSNELAEAAQAAEEKNLPFDFSMNSVVTEISASFKKYDAKRTEIQQSGNAAAAVQKSQQSR